MRRGYPTGSSRSGGPLMVISGWLRRVVTVGVHGGGPAVWPGAPGPVRGDVLVGRRDGGSGCGAADVHDSGCDAGGDAAGGVRERLPGLDLVVAVTMPVGADPRGGDHGQGLVVGGGPGGFGQRAPAPRPEPGVITRAHGGRAGGVVHGGGDRARPAAPAGRPHAEDAGPWSGAWDEFVAYSSHKAVPELVHGGDAEPDLQAKVGAPDLALCEPEPAGRRPAVRDKRGARQDSSRWMQGVEPPDRGARCAGARAITERSGYRLCRRTATRITPMSVGLRAAATSPRPRSVPPNRRSGMISSLIASG